MPNFFSGSTPNRFLARERDEAKQKEAEQKRQEAESQAQAEEEVRRVAEEEAVRVSKLTRLQALRAATAELDQRWTVGHERSKETQLWWREEKNEIERLRKLAKSDYSQRTEREHRLGQVDRLETYFLEKQASSIIYRMIWARHPPAAEELLEMRFDSMKGGRARDNVPYNTFVRGSDPRKWTHLAHACGVKLPEVTFTKAHVSELLGYSISGLERLMRTGRLEHEIWGHRTVRFRPDDIRKFIKTSAKWRHERRRK